MANKLSIAAVIDKNKITSENVFLVLIEVYVQDSDGNAVSTIRFCKNSENITFDGELFTASNFELDIKLETNQEPSITLTAQDQTKALAQYIDAYDGLVRNKVRMLVVNSASLGSPAELDETFVVTSSRISGYVSTLELGVESAVSQRFPRHRQFKDRCFKTFKGPRCQYAGPDATCSYSRTGVNGCIAKGNEINFGGFPGINELF
jgi:phage-related protein